MMMKTATTMIIKINKRHNETLNLIKALSACQELHTQLYTKTTSTHTKSKENIIPNNELTCNITLNNHI